MELINLERVLSKKTKELIIDEITNFANGDKYRVSFGQIYIGQPITDGDAVLNQIVDTVCEYYRESRSLVLSKTRKQPAMRHRQIIHFLARKYTKLSLSVIGRLVGNANYATTIHSVKTIQECLKDDIIFGNEIDIIERQILLAINCDDEL